ncbi:helix-turn-helix transcriptional regulator [Candidatus Contendibacter odensensis]|uniref:Transcriptional regulator, AraC family n=1 Tax=Candidatus Contendobacter odensis Run_B_J11 TaxID=1400861 RepID=A0A7U7GAA7_9GAMM|nr:AraC family transcriptional regulator [Candidatus Contendobacter odensis]CDH44401.1 putative Transcriptional regulator, AraC family [Candidatus Contendobacter odensis Run_B_J11]
MSKLYIWQNRGFFMGRLPDISEHRLGSAALCVGIDQPFRVLESESSGWREGRSVLVPPGCLHEIQVGGAIMAILFVEPEGTDYATIHNAMFDGEWQCLYGLADEAAVLAALRDAWERQPDAATIHNLLDRLIPPPNPEDRQHPLDGRIQRVIRLMKEDVTHSYSMNELAEYINLSPTRLVHLFKAEVGVPIRRFRQWHRMRVVAALIAKGDTLTDAALGAGFADSSHFSRAFRNMFGITPSSVFGRAANVQIVIA